MFEKRTRVRLLLPPTERRDPSVKVSIIGDLGGVGNELPVGRPVRRKLGTLRVEHALGRSTAEYPAEEAHAAVASAAEQNLATVLGPNGTQFGHGKIRIGDTEDSVFAEKVHDPNRRQDGVRIIVSVHRHVPLIWREVDRKIVIAQARPGYRLALPVQPGELEVLRTACLIQQDSFVRNRAPGLIPTLVADFRNN